MSQAKKSSTAIALMQRSFPEDRKQEVLAGLV